MCIRDRRVDGGTMMLEAISKYKTGETTAIGKFHGFELLVEKNFLGINYMVLRGKTEYKAEPVSYTHLLRLGHSLWMWCSLILHLCQINLTLSGILH